MVNDTSHDSRDNHFNFSMPLVSEDYQRSVHNEREMKRARSQKGKKLSLSGKQFENVAVYGNVKTKRGIFLHK